MVNAMRILAVMTRGLEAIGAEELSALPGIAVDEVAYRRVVARYTGVPGALPGLRTVDDVLLLLATRAEIPHTDEALLLIQEWAASLRPEEALAYCRQVRPIAATPSFNVTVGSVGRRNSTLAEIKEALASGIEMGLGWTYTEDDRTAEVNVRLLLEHDTARIGLRLAAIPLHRRAYKAAQLPGSTKPTVAAAMVRLAGVAPGSAVLAPCCGAGPILIEAALLGAGVRGGDNDPRRQRAPAAHPPRRRGERPRAALGCAPSAPGRRRLPGHRRQSPLGSPGGSRRAAGGALCRPGRRIRPRAGPRRTRRAADQCPAPAASARLCRAREVEISLFGRTPPSPSLREQRLRELPVWRHKKLEARSVSPSPEEERWIVCG
jgi:hypothetical protein